MFADSVHVSLSGAVDAEEECVLSEVDGTGVDDSYGLGCLFLRETWLVSIVLNGGLGACMGLGALVLPDGWEITTETTFLSQVTFAVILDCCSL